MFHNSISDHTCWYNLNELMKHWKKMLTMKIATGCDWTYERSQMAHEKTGEPNAEPNQ